ncbi:MULTISPECIES: MAC/perforin domain-containing protein [Bacteroides]|uniref:MAC/perforin domain-containing protein n=1 Tax=Bacteroides TaxID=816 RepID=UPI00202E9B89|nr:MAC/perforin domain-containing protein [Bacteroides fragilis]
MKIQISIVFFFFVFVSCSSIPPFDDNIDDVRQVSTRFSGDGVYDVLGYGYDITKEYLHPKSVRNPILDIEKYKKDYEARLVTGTPSWGGDKMYYGYSALDYLKDMTVETKAEALVGDTAKKSAFSGSISGSSYFNTRYSYSSKYSFASIDIVRNHKYIRINDEVSRLSDYLSVSFKEDVTRLSAMRLIEKYGTHVLTDFEIGGRYKLLFRSVIVNTSDKSIKKKAVASGLKAIVNSIGLSVNLDRNVTTTEELALENQHKELYVLFYGGSGTGLVYDLEKGLPTSIDIGKWESSVNLSNANLTAINWEETYPIYDFIQDPQKKQDVKKAVEQYLLGAQIKVLELKPLFHMYSKRQKNDFYVYTKYEADFLTGRWGDECLGIDGYILTNPEQNSKPMHKLHSWRQKNTFYVFSKQEADAIVAQWGDNYYGIDGYVLTQYEPNTKPMYKLHSWRQENTFYVFNKQEADAIVAQWGDRYYGIDGYIYEAD